MMASTIREQIIQAFVARASTLLTAAGFASNIGAHVSRGIKEVDPSQLPVCSLFPLPDTQVENAGSGLYLITFSIRVEGVAFFGTTNPSELAEVILGDIRKGFMAEAVSSLIERMRYASGGTDDYPEAKVTTIAASVVFEIKYFSKIDDPYS